MNTLVENDTGIELRVNCTEGVPPVVLNLSGATVLLRWRGDEAPVERAMTIIDGVNGVVSYIFKIGEIIAPDMEFEVQITDSAGNTRTSLQTFKERVRERLSS